MLAVKSGYVVNFTPDGRTAAKVGRNEYSGKGKHGKIGSMLAYVTKAIN